MKRERRRVYLETVPLGDGVFIMIYSARRRQKSWLFPYPDQPEAVYFVWPSVPRKSGKVRHLVLKGGDNE